MIAATTVVERVDGARYVMAPAERNREVVEVAAVAREASENAAQAGAGQSLQPLTEGSQAEQKQTQAAEDD